MEVRNIVIEQLIDTTGQGSLDRAKRVSASFIHELNATVAIGGKNIQRSTLKQLFALRNLTRSSNRTRKTCCQTSQHVESLRSHLLLIRNQKLEYAFDLLAVEYR